MLLVNQWRMPLVFLVSGLAVNFLRRRIDDGQMARQRLARLGIPLLFGMAVIIPPQAYLEALSNGATEPGYLAFLWHYFTFQGWPEGAFTGSHIGITWNHLWYLPYLLCYTLALIPLARFLDGRGAGLRRRFQALRGGWLVALPLVPLLASGLFVRPFTNGFTFDLVTDWYGHSQFFTFFLIGYLLGTDAGLWGELARLRRRALGFGLASFATLMFLLEVLPERGHRPAGVRAAGRHLLQPLDLDRRRARLRPPLPEPAVPVAAATPTTPSIPGTCCTRPSRSWPATGCRSWPSVRSPSRRWSSSQRSAAARAARFRDPPLAPAAPVVRHEEPAADGDGPEPLSGRSASAA